MANESKADEIPEELLSFPCEFQIKAMGKQVTGFDDRVRQIVSRHLNGGKILDLRVRESGTSKYVSVSCTIEATSRQQLDASNKFLAANFQRQLPVRFRRKEC